MLDEDNFRAGVVGLSETFLTGVRTLSDAGGNAGVDVTGTTVLTSSLTSSDFGSSFSGSLVSSGALSSSKTGKSGSSINLSQSEKNLDLMSLVCWKRLVSLFSTRVLNAESGGEE